MSKKSNKKQKKVKQKANKSKLAKQRKAQSISRLFAVAILGVIGFTIYSDLSANEPESRYATDEHLLEHNDVYFIDYEVDQLEAEYKHLPKQITVCWSESQQRLVPIYMGCK